jgi:tetratricopeptide (TPR) repeat protein
MFNSPNRPRLFLLGLAVLVPFVGAFTLHHLFSVAAQGKHAKSADYGSQMVEYTREGRYDEAIQTGLKSLHNDPSDGAVYQQIVVVYLIRAQKDSAQQKQWIQRAISYIDKALQADPDNPVNVRDLGFDFEKAGDLASDGNCQYYRRALDLSKRVVALLQSDHITAGGQTYPIDPERKEFTAYGHVFRIEPLQKANEKLSERLKTKLTSAKCE